MPLTGFQQNTGKHYTRQDSILTISKYWSEKQYGFKQGISSEHTLNLIQNIKEDKEEDHQTLLIAMDIQSAFDNIRWPTIAKNLKQSL